MPNTLLLSLVCPDRPGLISAVTGELFNLGVNLGDTNYAVMGEGAEFSAMLDAPAALGAEEIERHLKSLPELAQARLRVTPFDYGVQRGQTGTVTHHATLEGDDQPGLVVRLTELFLDFDANIVRMDTRTSVHAGAAHYVIELWVWIPEAREAACLGALNNTAASLGMGCEVSALEGQRKS